MQRYKKLQGKIKLLIFSAFFVLIEKASWVTFISFLYSFKKPARDFVSGSENGFGPE